MYKNWKVNDIISIGAKAEDFCSSYGGENFLFLDSHDIQLYPASLQITCNRPNCSYYCLDTRNREVVFYSCMNYHSAANDVNCINKNVDKFYRELGRVLSNESGISSFNHQVSSTDISDYNDAVLSGGVYNIVACINDSLAMNAHAINFGSISISPYIPLEPTHYISLSMGFVSPEVMDYFDYYITEISNRVMSYLSPLPNPWQYIRTTYDRVSNSFKIWMYTPSTLGISGISSLGITEDLGTLWNWLTTWIPVIIGVILIIVGIFVPMATWLGLLAIFGGIAILVWSVYSATTGEKKAEEKAKNSDIQNQQTDKENKANQANEDKWNNSPKVFDDCTARLEGRREIHKGIIDGYMSQYAKYGGFITEMKTEKDLYLNNVNAIINEFKTKPYTVDVCNSYFIAVVNVVNDSNIRISVLITEYIKTDEPYVTPPTNFGNKDDCEKAGYYWYDNKCHETGACWIPIPMTDICLLSADAGKGILLAGGLLAGVYLVYKVVKRKEV